ncbi:MAG TPA: oligoendopeptidase F [Steroidobacteraceae bacterium]|nr:oligoendopeptidase F [Steroidobacteraceae bacterium]
MTTISKSFTVCGSAAGVLATALLALAPVVAGATERADIPDRYKWDLSALYAGEQQWIAAKKKINEDIPQLARWQGRLGESPATLLAAMKDWEATTLAVERLYSYAAQLSSQDTRVGRHQQMEQEAAQVYTDLQSATAYMRPEILALGRPAVERLLQSEPALAPYRMFFDDILRAAPHTLSAAEEQIVARAGIMAQGPGAVHSIFTNAELPFPEVTLSTGEKVRLDAAAYTKYRGSPVQADRELVFKAFWGRYGEFTRTLATSLNAHVQSHVFYKDTRKFGSSLEAALFDYNIPTSVYTQLIADVHSNLPTLHRYLRLRQKIMGLDELGYEDLYAPIVDEVELEYTPEQAMQLTLEAFEPLGTDYVETLRKGYGNRWVDFLPTDGKSAGAYSTMVYGVHPYQLMNFNGTWEEVSTLAHESGHSMHSYLAGAAQPYATADYSIFVAEVASTLNENLLFRHAYAKAGDDRTRLFLLSSYLDRMRTTLFRQTLFAEFELRIHESVERGEPLTGESLSKLYLELLRTYYGADQGVVRIDDAYGAEWAYIPHFYSNFYVYQYATSMIGGMSLVDGIVGGEAISSGKATAHRDAYLDMLAAGSSKYPVELLKDAGVDMTTSQPFEAAMREMNRIMDEIEQIYARTR